MWVMILTDMVSRLISAFSLVFVNLPLLLFTDRGISWLAILLPIFAPSLTALMQPVLSRTRVYEADPGAEAFTGDPRGLANALAKLER